MKFCDFADINGHGRCEARRHAAQAYDLLGDQENPSKSLYQAINIADELGPVIPWLIAPLFSYL